MAAITPNQKDGKISSYRFRACVGRTDEGKQVFRSTTWKVPNELTPSKAEKAAQRAAERWEAEVRAEYQQDLQDPQRVKDRQIDKKKTDFARFVTEGWFPVCIDNGERKSTTITFYWHLMQCIVAHFKGRLLQKITEIDLQKFLITLRNNGFSPQTVRHHYNVLKMIFNFAVKQELLRKNPMDKVDRPKLPRKGVDALSQDEATVFFKALDACTLDFRCLLHVLITAGLRRGEVLGLKWKDLDEANFTLKVERNVTYTPMSGIEVNTPKTATGIRTVPVMGSTMALLKELKELHRSENPNVILEDAFIFHGKAGLFSPLYPSGITPRVKKFLQAAGLPTYSPHALRRTAATLLLSSGADIKSVQSILGHNNAYTTLTFYVRSDLQQCKAAAEKYAKAFGL